MIVYLINTNSGYYEDYSTWVTAAFIDSFKAEKYCLRKNMQIENLQARVREIRDQVGEDSFDAHPRNRIYLEILERGGYETEKIETKD